MSGSKTLFIAAAAVVVFAATVVALQPNDISANCLGCICEASSNCNQTIGCSSHAGYHCGPFLLSWNFWKDAGQPTLTPNEDVNAKGVFERCAEDTLCAADTVVLYMRNFVTDCNNDGVVSCIDFARIHKLGANGCGGNIPAGNVFFQKLDYCLAQVGE